MAKVFLTDINLNGNKLQNVAIESINDVSTIAQAQCYAGRLVFDSSDSKFKYYNGTAWIAGALYEAANANADVANVSYGVYKDATAGTGDNVGKTTLNFRSVAVAANESLTIAESGGVITFGLSVDGTTIGRDSTTKALKSLVTLKKLGTPTTGKDASYQLQDASGNAIGDTIDIDRDKFVKTAQLGNMNDTFDSTTGVITPATDPKGDTCLEIVFFLADGTFSLTKIDLQDFIEENEFGDGLQVVSHVVSVKKDSTSESFLSVGSDGVKVSGVQNAISTAAAAAKTEVTGESAASGPAVKVTSSTGAAGQTIYAVAGQDLASATTLATVNGDDTTTGSFRKAVKDAKTTIDAYTVNSKAISTSPTLDGSDVNLSNSYAEASTAAAPAAGDSIDTAIGKLQKEISSASGAALKSYRQTIATSSTSPVTIALATHGCGVAPMVQVYQNGSLVEVDVTNTAGAISIAWNGALSAALTVIITGDPNFTA